MNNNSDPLFSQYADMDFSDAKTVSEISALAQLQAEHREILSSNFIDSEVLNTFKSTGKGWQTRINDVLKEWLREHPDLKPV